MDEEDITLNDYLYGLREFVWIIGKGAPNTVADFVDFISSCIEGTTHSPRSEGLKRLVAILDAAERHVPIFTALVEPNHVDAVYRDAYYSCYSRHLAEVSRFTIRISLFSSAIDYDTFHEMDDKALQECYLGSTTIYPIQSGIVGETILRPDLFADQRIRLRLATFNVHVLGRKLAVDAFPYRMQDSEAMSCAEVTLVNLLEYYSGRYREYSSALPSGLTALEQDEVEQRVLPARGIQYNKLSQVLAHLGFHPKLISRYTIEGSKPGAYLIRRQLYWYLGSGIPLAVNVSRSAFRGEGHSLVAIGLADPDEEVIEGVRKYMVSGDASAFISRDARLPKPPDKVRESVLRLERNGLSLCARDGSSRSCRLYLESDIARDVIVMDDWAQPYSARPYQSLSAAFPDYGCEHIVAPLHRGMAIDAQEAYNVFGTLLESQVGLFDWARGYLRGDDEAVIARISLVTAANYVAHRSKTHIDLPPFGYIYESLSLPHFMWLMELIRAQDYRGESSRAFGEIALDATEGSKKTTDSKIVVMRYPGNFAWRNLRDGDSRLGNTAIEWDVDDPATAGYSTFPAYRGSLSVVEPL